MSLGRNQIHFLVLAIIAWLFAGHATAFMAPPQFNTNIFYVASTTQTTANCTTPSSACPLSQALTLITAGTTLAFFPGTYSLPSLFPGSVAFVGFDPTQELPIFSVSGIVGSLPATNFYFEDLQLLFDSDLGGSIVFQNILSFTMNRVTFLSYTDPLSRDYIRISGTTLMAQITNCVFQDIELDFDLGTLLSISAMQTTVTNVTISGAVAFRGIRVDAGTALMEGLIFQDSIQVNGIASFGPSAVAQLTDITCQRMVGVNTGCIMVDGGEVNITNSNFVFNLCYTSGGAVVAVGGITRIFDSQFDRNTIPTPQALVGGGSIFLESDAAVFIERCMFVNHTLTSTNPLLQFAFARGGVIRAEGSSLSVINSTFENNSVGNFGLGAHIYVEDGGNGNTVIITDTTFSRESTSGVAFSFLNGTVNLSGVSFFGAETTGVLDLDVEETSLTFIAPNQISSINLVVATLTFPASTSISRVQGLDSLLQVASGCALTIESALTLTDSTIDGNIITLGTSSSSFFDVQHISGLISNSGSSALRNTVTFVLTNEVGGTVEAFETQQSPTFVNSGDLFFFESPELSSGSLQQTNTGVLFFELVSENQAETVLFEMMTLNLLGSFELTRRGTFWTAPMQSFDLISLDSSIVSAFNLGPPARANVNMMLLPNSFSIEINQTPLILQDDIIQVFEDSIATFSPFLNDFAQNGFIELVSISENFEFNPATAQATIDLGMIYPDRTLPIQAQLTARDQNQDTSVSTILIEIIPVNDAPIIPPGQVIFIPFATTDVELANFVIDPDDETFTFSLSSIPLGFANFTSDLGAITMSESAVGPVLRIVPALRSQIILDLTATDSHGETATGTIFITIESESNDNTALISSVVVVVVVVICCAVIAVIGFYVWFKKQSQKNQSVTLELKDLIDSDIAVLYDVEVGQIIGQGAFGSVFRGTWQGSDVALKTIKGDDLREFSNELSLLTSVSHKHVIQFYGIFVPPQQTDQQFLVTEFMDKGDLLSFLRQTPELTVKDLSRICYEIGSGLNYLHTHKKIVHRDLACRNVLVHGPVESFVCKLADFGLSRAVDDYYTSTSKKIPVRWTAPEAITQHKFDQKTDVWAFGITMWETFERGSVPYPGLSNQEVVNKVCNEGFRLPPAPEAPPMFRKLIERCWDENPKARPTVADILKEFEGHKRDQMTSISSSLPSVALTYTSTVAYDLTNKSSDTPAQHDNLSPYIQDQTDDVTSQKSTNTSQKSTNTSQKSTNTSHRPRDQTYSLHQSQPEIHMEDTYNNLSAMSDLKTDIKSTTSSHRNPRDEEYSLHKSDDEQ